MRFRRWWHTTWAGWFEWREHRCSGRAAYSYRAAQAHRLALLRYRHENTPYRQDLSAPVTISGVPAQQLEDYITGDVPAEEFMVAEEMDTTHLARLATGLAEDTPIRLVPDLVPDLADEPDSPEADHLFWEQTAEDVLGGGLDVPPSWEPPLSS